MPQLPPSLPPELPPPAAQDAPPGALVLPQVPEEGSKQGEHVMASELRPVLRYTQDSEAGRETTAAETKQRAEEGVCSPGGGGREAPQNAQSLHGPARPAARPAERDSGVTRPPQSAHQADPARPDHPGHHEDHRHLPAPPAMDQTHQHIRRRPRSVGHAPAADTG